MENNIKEKFSRELFGEAFTCFNCNDERVDNNYNYLCKKCFDNITFITRACERCGDKVNEFNRYCDNCKEDGVYNFDSVICVAKLDGVARELVYKLKFGGKRFLAKCLAKFMAKRFLEIFSDKVDYICYVPITNKRRKERGYNQTEEMAFEFSKLTNIKVYKNLFLKIKDTADQTRLKRDERNKNLKDAFVIIDNAKLKNKVVLIIDDVFTTGATMNVLANLLRKKGVKRVYGLTFCHA